MNVQLKNFLRFLRSRQWVVAVQSNERVIQLESPKAEDGDYASVILPHDMSFADSTMRIRQALTEVAGFLALSIDDLADRIERWDADIIRTRLFRRAQETDSIPLTVATLIVDDLKTFVGYAAYTQSAPSKFFSKAGRAAADFAEHCRFGHTFKGSFGVKIECPLSNIGQLAFTEDLQDAPFERLVTERIATGYESFNVALQKDDPTPLLKGFEFGMNANMLRVLADIYENLDALQVEYSIDWSPELKPSRGLETTAPVKFDGRAYELARYAATELEKDDDQEVTTIVSHVVSLKSEMPLSEGIQDEFDHVITIDWEREKGSIVRVRVILPAGEYKKACDAHKLGKKIQISGAPKKEGKFWILNSPSEIRFHA